MTAYLLYARELWQNNALALQCWCLSNALTLRFRPHNVAKSQRACIICHHSLTKVNTQLLIYKHILVSFVLIELGILLLQHIFGAVVYFYQRDSGVSNTRTSVCGFRGDQQGLYKLQVSNANSYKTNKQAYKQTNNPTNKQTNKTFWRI